MRYRSRGIALLLLICLAASLFLPAAAASKQAVVKRNNTPVYAKPKAKSKILGTLSKGTVVTVISVKDSVARIKYSGKTGYVKKSALSMKSAPSATIVPAQDHRESVTRKTVQNAYAYRKASTKSKRTQVKAGTKVRILQDMGNWYKIERNGVTAYMLKEAFESPKTTAKPTNTPNPRKTPKPTKTPKPQKTPAPAPMPSADPAPTRAPSGKTRTLAQDAIVYKKADLSAKVLATLPSGSDVTVLKTGRKWVRIRLNGTVGYIVKSAFQEKETPAPKATDKPTPTPKPTSTPKPAKTASPPAPDSSRADRVVAAALAQLGKPYVYGSTGTRSFDCSGLTYYSYRQVGITLPHSAYSVGYGGKGTKITSVSGLKKGDVLCFNTISDGDLCDHVGIYIGGGQFVHASSGKGRVIVSSVTSGYYAGVFSWAKRYL
ncbi:MAG: SH3 domain-containing protein [Clostridia bacterium]|nr:SH3 domain-containing protein [Clostridia bacterium]